MKHRMHGVIMSAWLLGSLAAQAAAPTDVERLHQYRRTFHTTGGELTNFGATGCQGWFYWDRFFVCTVDTGSPADGILQTGDYIIKANGESFPGGEDPRPTFGRALTEAEAKGGKLRLRIIHGAEERDVVVPLKPLGAYAAAWPFGCAKSKQIYDDAISYVMAHQSADGTFGGPWSTAHDGLLLLTSDKPEYVEAARRAAYGRMDGSLGAEYHVWTFGYSTLLLAEYYLRTGDSAVLPSLQKFGNYLSSSQAKSGGWGHNSAYYGIVQGYGEVNQAGIPCFLSMILLREAGIEVDAKTFQRSVDFFGSFAGAGCMHYGDGFPWTGEGENGLNAAGAIAFNLLGDTETMKEYAHNGARAFYLTEGCHTSSYWPHVWAPIGARLATDELYQRFMKEQAWYYDLCRRWDGSIVYIPHPENFMVGGGLGSGPVWPTGGYGLVYAMPTKSLRILNAKPGVFGRPLAPTLEPVRHLFKEKRWSDFDAAMAQWGKDNHSAADKLDAADLLAARARTRDHLAWVTQQVRDALAQKGDLYKARVMLAAAERLNGAKLEFDDAARAALQKGVCNPAAFALPLALTIEKNKPQEKATPQAMAEPQMKVEPKTPSAWYGLLTASDKVRATWRTHAWAATTYTQPVMDNLRPAAADMANWHLPEFDDSAWKQGQLPMNDGPQVSPTNPVFKARKELYQGYGIFYAATPYCNRFLRTQFTLDDPAAVDAMRVLVKGGGRTEIYLNGFRIAEVLSPNSQPCMLAPDAVKLLRNGANTLAAYVAGGNCSAGDIVLQAAGGKRSAPPP